jgi:hypothetical protein
MDSTTKQRYISTSIWSDEWFDSLSTQEKLIYFHLLTNEFTNAAGVYHFSLKQIRIDLDISREEVNGAIEKFQAAGKAYYYREYIVIPKWLKHQKISERSRMFLGALSILRGLPAEIKRFIADRKHYDFPVEKYVEIPSINKDSLCPVEDSLCPVEDSLCQKRQKNSQKRDRLCSTEDRLSEGEKGKYYSPGIAYAKNGKKTAKNGIGYAPQRIGYAKNAENSAHNSDLDLSGGGRSANLSSREENPPVDNSGPSGALPPPLDLIKTESEAAGFVIPDNLARHMADSTAPPWLSGPHSYFRFVAEQLRDSYRKNPKTEAELRKLYLSALWNGWENFRKAYPAWRQKQESAEQERIAVHARDHPPEVCPGCGGAMKYRKCPACGGLVQFREQDLSWVFIPPVDFNLAGDFRDKIRRKEVPRGEGKPVLDF